VAQTYYRIGEETLPYGEGIDVSAEGTTTIEYWSVDAAGNVEATNTATVMIDSLAPASSDDAPQGWQDGPVSVHLSATDPTSGVAQTYYRIGEETLPYGEGIDVSAEGTTTIEYWSVDRLGNREETNTVLVRIDTVVPFTSHDAPEGWVTEDAEITLTADDTYSGVETTHYRIDDGQTQSYSGTFTVSNQGTSTITYWSVDAAGNSEAPKSTTVQVDTGAPSTTGTFASYYTGPFTTSLVATDARSGVALTQWRLDGGAWVESPLVEVSTPGTHTVEYQSFDVAGNAETPKSANFTLVNRIEETNPAVVRGGSWSPFSDPNFSGSGGIWTFSAGRTITVRFTGTRIEWLGSRGSSYGIATVAIDGGAAAPVDLYSSGFKSKQTLFSSGDLPDGDHTLLLTVTGTYNPPSTGSRVYVDAFDIVGTATP
jgi:hypothetical protein